MQRVRWAGPSENGETYEGTEWKPHKIFKNHGESDYQYAIRMGVCRDELPPGDYVLVQWDSRPGVIQCHPRSEVEFLDAGA